MTLIAFRVAFHQACSGSVWNYYFPAMKVSCTQAPSKRAQAELALKKCSSLCDTAERTYIRYDGCQYMKRYDLTEERGGHAFGR